MRKKLITMGLVSALGASTSVMAADLDATAPGNAPETFASDTATVAEQNTDGTIDLNFAGAGVVNNTAMGVGVAGGNQTFVRFDLTASEFEGAVNATNFAITGMGGTATSVAQGGADGGTFVIFDVTSVTATPITQTSQVSFAPNVAASLASSATVSMSVYETLTGAVNETDSLYTVSGAFAAFSQGLTTTNIASSATADVSSGFTNFTAATGVDADTAALGNFAMVVTTTSTGMNTGAVVAGIAEMAALATTDLTLTGDVSFGDWFIDANGNNCGAVVTDLIEDTTTFETATANAGALAAGMHYNLCVDVDGTEVMNAGDYSILFEWDTGTRPFPTTDATVNVGSIARNGTTVYMPYLTTFEDYNQRIVIVNRGATAADYSFTFTSESDTTATAGSAATGSVPAGEVLSLRVSDVVTLAGKTRTAATLVVVAPSANIDVATNQVNLSDGSTDTVVLQ